MRTTLDLDDDLLRTAQSRFPPGTPKTMILEEGLRALIRMDARPERSAAARRLIASGVLTPATERGAPPHVGGLSLADVLAGLDEDRGDR